jgi:hypothetical protein
MVRILCTIYPFFYRKPNRTYTSGFYKKIETLKRDCIAMISFIVYSGLGILIYLNSTVYKVD